MNEVFLDIPNYEGLYQISNFGRVRRNGKILKPAKDTNGYLQVGLCKNGIRKNARIHRLVALTFLPNPNNYPEINHKNEDKTNNVVENLEWCTREYNINYGSRNEKASERISEIKSKPVLQFDKEGNFIKEWIGQSEASRRLNIPQGNISKCCLGSRNSAGGYIFKYKY